MKIRPKSNNPVSEAKNFIRHYLASIEKANTRSILEAVRVRESVFYAALGEMKTSGEVHVLPGARGCRGSPRLLALTEHNSELSKPKKKGLVWSMD